MSSRPTRLIRAARPQRRSPGFTLLEVVIALGLVMLIGGLVAGSLGPWLAFQQNQETLKRLAASQRIWQDWLERNAAAIEQAPQTGGLAFGQGWLADGTLLASEELRAQAAAVLGPAGVELFEDGFHRPWVLRISDPLSHDQDGVVLHYHVLALLSAGANGVLEPATRFDPATGALSLAGDDRGLLIDGWPIARAQLQTLESRLQRAASLWQDWFRARWEGDASRDASIDYFASACPGDLLANAWDGASGALSARCQDGDPPAAPGEQLGLSASELRDPTGAPLDFDAHSGATRNPDRTDIGQNAPPYSARVSGHLPGGTLVQRTVLGTL